MLQQLYLHNPDLNPAVYMLDKDKSEHYAAGSVLVERALTGIRSAIAQLSSPQTADFESLWQSCAASPQQQAGDAVSAPAGSAAKADDAAAATTTPADTADIAEAYIRFLAAAAKNREAVMLGNTSAHSNGELAAESVECGGGLGWYRDAASIN